MECVLRDIPRSRWVVYLDVAYFSRTLPAAEKNYCVIRQKLLAMVVALRHFQSYLYRQHFLLRTDHASLMAAHV